MIRNQCLVFLLLFLIANSDLFAQTQIDTAIVLRSVDVQGFRFSGLSNGEIKRLQVDRNHSGFSLTASEALRQIPSVVTDIEGAVFYRGSDRSEMLINGVPYGLLEENSGDMLIQLPALFFNQLSLRSSPGIEWMPDGDAGVLNLASSSYSSEDSPVTVILGGGLQERYNAGVVFNLHPGKFHIIGKYNYRKEFRDRKYTKTTTTETGTTELNNSASARPDVHLADLSIGYGLTDKDVITAYGLYYRMDYDRYAAINNTRYNPAGEVMNKILRHRFNYQRQEAYSIEGRWLHHFTNPEDRLELAFNYNNFVYDEDNDFQNENTQGTIVAQDNLYLLQKKHNYYLSASYQKKFDGNWLLKAGLQSRFRDENYSADAYDLKEGEWVANAAKIYSFEFHRNINLVYLAIEKKLDWGRAEAGLQAEHTHLKAAGEKNNYFHLYPQVKIGLQTVESSELLLSYQQRVSRPYGSALNPFIDRSDATYIKKGNPDLKDEHVHGIELSYQWDMSRIRVVPALYYRYKTNRIMDILITENDADVWKKENLGNSNIFGAEMTLTWNPFSNLSINVMGNVYRDEIDGRQAGYGEKKKMTSWDMKGVVSYVITPTTEIQLDGFYVSDQLTPQGKLSARSSVNAGISQYFMKRKLRANLSINNIFDGMEERLIIHTDAIQMKSKRNRDVRVTWLTLTYNI